MLRISCAVGHAPPLILFDMSNVVPSLGRGLLSSILVGARPPEYHSFLEHHHAESLCVLPVGSAGCEQTIVFEPSSGVSLGRSVATQYFDHSLRRSVLEP